MKCVNDIRIYILYIYIIYIYINMIYIYILYYIIYIILYMDKQMESVNTRDMYNVTTLQTGIVEWTK